MLTNVSKYENDGKYQKVSKCQQMLKRTNVCKCEDVRKCLQMLTTRNWTFGHLGWELDTWIHGRGIEHLDIWTGNWTPGHLDGELDTYVDTWTDTWPHLDTLALWHLDGAFDNQTF